MGRDTREMRWEFQWGGQHLATAEPCLTAGSYGLLLTQLTSSLPREEFQRALSLPPSDSERNDFFSLMEFVELQT